MGDDLLVKTFFEAWGKEKRTSGQQGGRAWIEEIKTAPELRETKWEEAGDIASGRKNWNRTVQENNFNS